MLQLPHQQLCKTREWGQQERLAKRGMRTPHSQIGSIGSATLLPRHPLPGTYETFFPGQSAFVFKSPHEWSSGDRKGETQNSQHCPLFLASNAADGFQALKPFQTSFPRLCLQKLISVYLHITGRALTSAQLWEEEGLVCAHGARLAQRCTSSVPFDSLPHY